ncbi:NAD(P)/FAD-dependent oxidoreductase [Scleromatobacter humisilvae]|uniref:NAD(P)/FAD-dependent oxidoreductase n=1 Tax=Scleromatobacter humisilvae TaxID=2897159 RepID=A0A9X2C404_9BURK|nr:NAD(P)/FAD-dependent oxidoreductase [Scleromatobacter humisilvae]MCK9689119.1 NAD(P)/FAD-dependent oxidoreductase [Scleromatobacter humisilvae]
MKRVDVVVIGAGAAGLFCAAQAGQRGARVLLIDHADKIAEKIRISGGGRCNFTNRDATPANFHSRNPHFCRSALARYTSQDFIALVQRHRIAFHEKHRGQLFCDDSSQQIIDLLMRECEDGNVERWQPCAVRALRAREGAGERAPRYEIDTDRGPVEARSVVIATGGLPVPKIGATDFGLRIAKQFGHPLVEPRPALVPLVFDAAEWAPFVALAGVSLEVEISSGSGKQRARFVEDLLFTHRGLSGPAVLQASSYWQPGETLQIAFAPGTDWCQTLSRAKATSRRQLGNELATHLPQRLAQAWLARGGLPEDKPMPEVADKPLRQLAESLSAWRIAPAGTEGWKKAEVMAGGVDTREIDSKTMESRRAPGLHFIGEVVDVTGWLGGYNFQWAWASGYACAEALAADSRVAAA